MADESRLRDERWRLRWTAAPLDDQGNNDANGQNAPKNKAKMVQLLPCCGRAIGQRKNKRWRSKLRPMGTVMKPFVAGKVFIKRLSDVF